MELTGRRTTVTSLLVLGPIMLLGGVLAFLLPAAARLDGYDWPEDRLVPVDGRPHAVEVDPGGGNAIWTSQAAGSPRCEVVDRGGPVDLERADGSYVRGRGQESWIATATFTAGQRVVDVTCTGPDADDGSTAAVAVEPTPWLPPALATYGNPSWLSLGLVGAGLLGTLAAPLVVRLGRRRDEPSAPED